MPSPRWVRWSLIAVLAWAFVARAWFGSIGLDPSRFWDERYGLENIHVLLTEGQIKPANGYHPSLSYLPQAAILGVAHQLHQLTGRGSLAVVRGKGFTPLAYRLCRLSQAVLGTISLYVLFLIGRRLFGPEVGLMSTFVMAAVPWHIRQSAIYKPDILLILTLEVALLCALVALDRSRLRQFLLAGGAIGLALATKFNAGPIALPVTVLAFWRGRRDRRYWAWICAAGAASIVTFLILNPYILLDRDLYVTDFNRTLRDYQRKGIAEQSSKAALLLHAGQSLTTDDFHGGVEGTVALLGLGCFFVWALRRGIGKQRRLELWMLLSFPLSYVLLYSLSTTNPSAHNWLPLLPISSLAAGWLIFTAWQTADRYLQVANRRWPLLFAFSVVVFMIGAQANRYVYNSVIPTNVERAESYLRKALSPLAGRHVVADGVAGRMVVKGRHGNQAAVASSEDLTTLPASLLQSADAEVFSQTTDFSFPNPRLSEERIFSSALFEGRGVTVTTRIHPWHFLEKRRLLRESFDNSRDQRLMVPLPEDLRSGDSVSLEFWLPKLRMRGGEPQVLIAGREVRVLRCSRTRFLVPRFVLSEDEEEIELLLPKELAPSRTVAITAFIWSDQVPRKDVTADSNL